MTRQKLASKTVLVARFGRNVGIGLIIVVLALVIGMAGYAWFGAMGWTQAFANAAMILSGMGPLDKLETPGGQIFEGIYALVCGLLFFAIAGLILAPLLHRMLHRFHIEDTER
jgi:sterol desaturase/sphingolipid hydroxylase (fatty acid hydroxylase superfamily)